MSKKILRILSVALACLLLMGMFGQSESSAAQTEEYRISQQVESTYKAALKAVGRYSFRGWCGAAVDWQLQMLGITTKVIGANGNDQFDQYKNQEYSSGGYRIRAYAARNYTLKEALNTVSENGTKDVYNILVGFQKTNTTAGQKYGHAVFIHAILDGVVYFTESFSITIGGKTYAEGKCVAVSIDQFANHYSRWTTFDGIICFGMKSYTDLCTEYPAYLYAVAAQETQLYTAPCQPEVDDRAVFVRTLQPGERVSVTGMFCNTEGEYWYRVEDNQTAYVRADHMTVQNMRYDDVTASGISAPTVHQQGNTFNVKGTIGATYNQVCSVRAQVFALTQEGVQHALTMTDKVTDNQYSLSYSTISNRLAFRLLEEGSYRYELAVVVSNYFYADGELQTQWKTIKLYLSEFHVVSQKGNTATITYDACGGTAELNAAELFQGQTLNTLPDATREGFVFAGWYTQPEGGERVAEDFVVQGDMKLYAHWEAADVSGWYEENGQVYYLLDGQRIVGFFQVDGVDYYQGAGGYLCTGWLEENGCRYYLNANGSMATGWLELNGCRYYLGTDGTATTGWAEIEGNTYFFADDGLMLTGKQTIEDVQYNFDDNGILIVA